jgi:peptide/nickel transport system substrate-binding protein
MQFSRSLVLSLLVLAGASAGCRRNSDGPATAGSTKNNVVWQSISDIQRLNPYTSSDANAQYVAAEIWEPLNNVDPRTLEPYAGIASLPVISEDKTTFTYTLDPRATFSDGKKLTAEDVIFSFKAAMNPKVIDGQSLRNYLMDIDSVYIPGGDASKVEFHLKKTYFNTPSILGQGYVPILAKHIMDPKNLTDKITWADLKNNKTTNSAVQEFATWFESSDIARDPKHQIGTGAYIFTGWVTNDHLMLKKNPNYWAKDMKWRDAYPDELIFKTISDQSAAFTALKSHDVDLIEVLTPEQYSNLDPKKAGLRKDTVYYNNYSYIAWNTKRPIFKDVKTRRALTALIDRNSLIQHILKGLGKPADGPVVFTQPNVNPNVRQIGFNVDTAKRLLAEAGWADTDGDGILDRVIDGKKTPFKFTFLTNAGNDTRKQVLLVLSEQFRKVGIDAQVSAIEWSVYLENTRGKNFDAAYSAIAGNATEDELYQSWHSSQASNKGSNFYSYMNPEADKLMEAIRVEFDKAKRWEMSYKLQEMIVNDQPVSFLFCTPARIGMVDRFDNVEFFRSRPGFDPRYFIVRGAGIKKTAQTP